jgi:hypothetical protein
VSLAEDQHPVGDLGSGGEHEPFRQSVALGACGGLARILTPAAVNTASKDSMNWCPIPDQEPDRSHALAKVHQEAPRCLRGRRAVGMHGDAD